MQVNAAVDAIKSRSDKQKPFYLSLHTEEPHNYIAFFSYDVQDERVIKEELDYLEPLVNECGKEFSGSLTYQLSLRYVDLNIQRLFEKLQQIGELEKTTILITADHGSSYTFNPIRDVVVTEILEFCDKFRVEDKKTPIVVVPSSFNTITNEELAEHGVNIVIYANQLTRSAFPVMQQTAMDILKYHRAKEVDDRLMPIKKIVTLIDEL